MSNSYNIRPFKPVLAEYEAIVRVFTQAEPLGTASVHTWQHWDRHRDPARLFNRYVLEQAGEIGGYGFSMRTDPAADSFRFAIYFSPGWQTAARIDHFYSYIINLCLQHAPQSLICQTREDEPHKIAWLRNQGFQQAMRYPCSVLDVNNFDPGAYAGLKSRLAAQGIAIVSLAELAKRDPDWQRKVYDLEMLLSQDVPRPSTFVPPPFAQYRQSNFDDPAFLPQLWFIALHGDDYIGTTSLSQPGEDSLLLENHLTGTRRDYRRRGLATALKCAAVAEAQHSGAQRIVTYNEENNPMFQLNLKLGFQPHPADIDWEKTLS